MAKKKLVYTDEDKAKALVAIAATGGNVSKVSKMLGVSRSTLRNWQNGEGVTGVTPEMVSETASGLAEKFEKIANILTDALMDPAKLEKATLAQVASAAGIATDRMQLLKSMPTSITGKHDLGLKAKYERTIETFRRSAAKQGFPVDRDEALDYLSINIPDIKEIMGVQ